MKQTKQNRLPGEVVLKHVPHRLRHIAWIESQTADLDAVASCPRAFFHFAHWEPSLIRYDPPVPRIGFGVAAVIMSALTMGLMVVLPSALEQEGSALAMRAAPNPAAAVLDSEDTLHLRCTVPPAVNAPLFPAARATGPDPQCKQQS